MLIALLLLLGGGGQAAPPVRRGEAPVLHDYIDILKLARKDLIKTGPTADEKAILESHAAYHAKLAKDGIEIAAGPTMEDDPLGIAIFTASSDDEAKKIMENDPAVAKGVMTARCIRGTSRSARRSRRRQRPRLARSDRRLG